jgi:hypothetical protein
MSNKCPKLESEQLDRLSEELVKKVAGKGVNKNASTAFVARVAANQPFDPLEENLRAIAQITRAILEDSLGDRIRGPVDHGPGRALVG